MEDTWVTLAGVAFADALEGAVVRADGWKLAGVTCKARIALANALVAVAVVVAVVRARWTEQSRRSSGGRICDRSWRAHDTQM